MKTNSWFIYLLLLLLTSPAWASPKLDEARRAIRMQDFSLAAKLFQQAAEQGESEASYQLATLYLLGHGLDKNEKIAEELLSSAAEQGHAAAQYSLGVRLLERDPDTAMGLINQAAQQQYQAALNFLKQAADNNSAENTPTEDAFRLWLGSARADDADRMTELLLLIDDIDDKDENGRTALHIASQFHSSKVVEWLLQQGADPDSIDQFGLSPLADAMASDHTEIALMLLAHSQNLSLALPNGDSLVHLAVRHELPEITVALIEKGVALNRQNNDGWTPLDLAVQSENTELSRILSSLGATHSTKSVRLAQENIAARHNTLLEESLANEQWDVSRAAQVVVSGNIASLQTVLDQQPNLVNTRLDDGSNLLTLAIKNDLVEIVEVLLNSGANPGQTIYGDISALHIAARQGNQEVVELLLQHGADPLAKDQDDWDTMDWAVTENQFATATFLASWLINHKSDISEKIPFDHYVLLASQHDIAALVRILLPHTTEEEYDETGRNSLWFAANNGNDALLKILLKNATDVTSTDRQGRTPFHAAIQSGCLSCANLLLAVSDLNRQTSSGYTPLMIAVARGNPEMVNWLLMTGADIELRNGQGNTALILAVEQNLTEIVRLLLDANANVTRKNNLGYSAMDIAKDNNPELYDELRSRTVFGLF